MTEGVVNTEGQNGGLPFQPSWIDRLIAWMNQLPIPLWLLYGLSIFIVAIMVNAVFWVDGSVPSGTVDPANTLFSVFVFYWLALYQYLNTVGSQALRTFSPLLEVNEREIERMEYQFATLPRWLGWISIPLGYGLAVLTIFSEPEPYGEIVPNTVFPYIGDILVMGFLVSTLVCVILRSIRQLRMVGRLHAGASNFNLLKLGPAHAFSSLTARTGIGVLLILIFGFLLDPNTSITTVEVFWYTAISILSIAIFILPIIGIRRQLEEEKEKALNHTSDLIQKTSSNLHQKISQGKYEDLHGMETAISALIRERELLEKVSTWPWNPGTLRGFASALLLPIVIWLITELLDRVI